MIWEFPFGILLRIFDKSELVLKWTHLSRQEEGQL